MEDLTALGPQRRTEGGLEGGDREQRAQCRTVRRVRERASRWNSPSFDCDELHTSYKEKVRPPTEELLVFICP